MQSHAKFSCDSMFWIVFQRYVFFSLGVTTVLTMLTLASQTNYSRDEVIIQSTTACDIYIWCCFAFVIAAMVEFAVADYCNKPRFQKPKQAPKKSTAKMSSNIQDLQNNLRDRNGETGMGLLRRNVSMEENSFVNLNKSTMGTSEQGDSDRYSGREPFTAPERRSAKPVSAAGSSKSDAMWTRLAHYVHIESRHTSSNVDIVSRVLFPIGFLLFNFAYWLTIVFKFRS